MLIALYSLVCYVAAAILVEDSTSFSDVCRGLVKVGLYGAWLPGLVLLIVSPIGVDLFNRAWNDDRRHEHCYDGC